MIRHIIHAFGIVTAQESSESFKISPPAQVYKLGVSRKNRPYFWGYDPAAHIGVFSSSYSHMESTYGNPREEMDNRIFDRKVEDTGAMTVPRPLTDYLKHGIDIEVVNFEKDDKLVLFTFGSMIGVPHTTMYVARLEDFNEILREPSNLYHPNSPPATTEQDSVLKIVWQGKDTVTELSHGPSGIYHQIEISTPEGRFAMGDHLTLTEAQALLSLSGGKTERSEVAEAVPTRIVNHL